ARNNLSKSESLDHRLCFIHTYVSLIHESKPHRLDMWTILILFFEMIRNGGVHFFMAVFTLIHWIVMSFFDYNHLIFFFIFCFVLGFFFLTSLSLILLKQS